MTRTVLFFAVGVVVCDSVVSAQCLRVGANRGDREAFHRIGESVGGNVHLNGDTYADYFTGSGFSDESYSGVVRAFSGLTRKPLYTLYGAHAEATFGYSVARVSDLNNDGRDDFVVGAPNWTGPASSFPYVAVFSGTNGTLVRTHYGLWVGSTFGYTVADGGDIDNDGAGDYLVRDPLYDGAGTRAVLVFSGATGAVLYEIFQDSVTEIIDGDLVQGEWISDVDGTDDVNGDGYGDFIVSWSRKNVPDRVHQGHVRVYSGADGSVLFQNSTPFYDTDEYPVVQYVARAGDVFNDGFADFMYDFGPDGELDHISVHSGPSSGLIRVFSPSPYPLSHPMTHAGDLDQDGYGDFAFGSPGNGLVLVSGQDGSVLCNFPTVGTWDLAFAGDTNNDGHVEVIAGDAFFDGQIGNPDNELGRIVLVGYLNCTGYVKADTNCNGTINAFDIDPFVLALEDPPAYAAAYPECSMLCTADMDSNGTVNSFDIQPFVDCLVNDICP